MAAVFCTAFTASFSGGGHAQPTFPTASTAAHRQLDLGELSANRLYALTISVKDPSQIQESDSIHIAVADAQGTVIEKSLHVADLDFYLTLHPRANGKASVLITSAGPIPDLTTTLRPVPVNPVSAHAGSEKLEPAMIAAQPNSTWQTAQPFEFGQTIYGSADERPYAPAPDEDGYAAMLKGFQWFKFTFKANEPRLAHFILNITDRDVPLDVDIFRLGDYNGAPDVVPYTTGEFIYQVEATQNYPGLYKFRTRVLKPGDTYYVRVDANHPAYQLHTLEYPIPPYRDPRQAGSTSKSWWKTI